MKKLFFALILAAFAASTSFAGGMPVDTALEKALTPQESYFKAVRAGNVAGAKSFLDAKTVSINAQDATDGNTGLHIAVANADVNMVLALVLYSPSTTPKNNKGETIMDVANATGNQQIIMALKQAGF